MWEEDVQTVRVLHRRVSEMREGGEESGGESEEEFLNVGDDPSSTEHIPLLLTTSKKPGSPPSDASLPAPPPSLSVPSVSTGGTGGATRSELTHAESFLEQGPPAPRLLLSNCGKPFSDPGTSPTDLPSAQPCIYGLLTAEQPYYSNKAKSFAEKFSKAASNSKAVHLRWERPDFKVLYRFHSIAEYSAMVRDLKEGRLSGIKVKGETLRAVMLEPVRVVDASLKCMVEATFPPSINEDIKQALKPVIEPIAISRRFIFVPSTTPHIQQLSAVEGTDSAGQYPPLLMSLITSQSQSSTERKISEALQSSNWMKCSIPLQLSSPKPFVHDEIFMYKEHSTLLPLVGLTVGQAGKAIEDGIRLTLFCAKDYPLMVKFYNLVLEADPVNMKNYVIFSLMTEPTSILELCIYDSPSISTYLLDWISLHFFVSDLLPLVSQLSKEFKCDFGHLGKGLWQTRDPCGNMITIHDRGTLTL